MTERSDEIRALMQKARQALDDAELLLSHDRVEGAVNRIYYAAFDAAKAGLLTEGETPSGGHGPAGRVNGHLPWFPSFCRAASMACQNPSCPQSLRMSMPVFKGHYRRPIDDTNRIALPEAMRDVSPSDRYTLTRGLEEGLFLYPAERWAEVEEEISALNVYDETVRDFCRRVLMWAYEVETGAEGRLELPAALAEFAGLSGEGIVLGAFDHVEIWDPSRLEAYLSDRSDDYPTLVEQVMRT